ncbi:MAG: dihydropteroate synthase [Fimbriimonadaceae bacterium]|nr:dihydropteroate synthase [Fimbriimonadaceae bacterium]
MPRPQIMGVINVTPDSFSDGGQFDTHAAAIAHGLALAEDGADWLDIGGESTRPGAEPVDAEEELLRVVPVVAELARRGLRVSIDTMKPAVARAAIEAGATMINDVSGFRDPAMVQLAQSLRTRIRVCVMHMPGEPRTMQSLTEYPDGVEATVTRYLLAQANALGLPPQDVYLDPGIGFGKTVAQNRELLRAVGRLRSHGYPVLIGASRKSFIGKVLGSEAAPRAVETREAGTLAVHLFAQEMGADMIRTHDVRAAVDAAQIWEWLRA